MQPGDIDGGLLRPYSGEKWENVDKSRFFYLTGGFEQPCSTVVLPRLRLTARDV
ncbi:hypothetical protein LHK_03066 [Laribacter hongkongensis HLHK9]|uniref:Uncharacterized protein n=2 Tax=Laribacter hongkongensis TaxID=168471 RepID=C1D5M7_LARHH|nr:hypothetical protein LHK_03066 [Laribacter hongkongensis HLHK9]ASJ26084.1 hypothetical protein LHGZ1_3253 [Laribacter hongkongensis]